MWFFSVAWEPPFIVRGQCNQFLSHIFLFGGQWTRIRNDWSNNPWVVILMRATFCFWIGDLMSESLRFNPIDCWNRPHPPSNYWGILVKLVIYVSSGHLKFKIANFTQYVTFACFLPWSNTLSLENTMGSLIAPLTKLLYLINGNSMSRGDIKKIMQCVWQGKGICSAQMNCQRQYLMVSSIVGINHISQNLRHNFVLHSDTMLAFVSLGHYLEISFNAFKLWYKLTRQKCFMFWKFFK